MKLLEILKNAGLVPAEYAVFWHVSDTIIRPREFIANWAAAHLPNNVSPDITLDDCLRATDSLIRKGLLIELTADDIEQDLTRWRREPLPVSWGVDRDRCAGDVDLSEAGFRLNEDMTRQMFPDMKRGPVAGYNDDQPGVIRVFGETEEACHFAATKVVARIHENPWRWPPESIRMDEIRPLGPWWYSRFECISVGFEIVLRRTAGLCL